jgi:guanylate kinase
MLCAYVYGCICGGLSKMKKGIVLFGPSGCGKTALSDYINENFRYTNIVSTTTREPRHNEVDGVDYHFIKLDEFKLRVNAGLFLEISKHGDFWYGIELSEIDNKEYGVVVVNCEGVMALQLRYEKLFTSIFIYLDDKQRLLRQVERGDEIGQIASRFYLEEESFHNAKMFADHTINMNGTTVEQGVQEILELVR